MLNNRKDSMKAKLVGVLALSLISLFPMKAYSVQSEMQRRLHNPAMEYEIGRMYYYGKGVINGKGVEKDYAMAMKHFTKAASYGSVDARFFIGLMHYQGTGVKKNYAEAFKWLNEAAASNNGPAILLLGQMYQNGEGTTKDNQKAIEWYKKEAVFGNDLAEYSIAIAYLEGLQPATSAGQSAKIISVLKNKETGKHEIEVYFNRSRSADDIAEAEKWLQKAASKGNADAMYTLSTVYYQAVDNPEKSQKMISLLKGLSAKGRLDAQVLLGILYFNGSRVEEDRNEAYLLFNTASQQGNDDAKFILGMLNSLK